MIKAVIIGFAHMHVNEVALYISEQPDMELCAVASTKSGTEEIPALPNKDQLILVYCRSGNRSKQASEKLVALGYTDIVEFGGINSWPGEIVTD